MAAVSQGVRRGVYDFAHKTFNRYVQKSQNRPDKRAIRASLSTGFLLGDIQNDDLRGAENAANKVTVGVSPGSYTTVTPLFGAVNDVCGKGNVKGYYYYLGRNKEYSLPKGIPVQYVERNLTRYLSYAEFRRTLYTSRPGSRPLCWGHEQSVFTRAYSGNGTCTDPLYKTKTGYYEILEVTPTATQAQIKTAYYKQSFVYHPDRNAGSEAATVRFSEISEAYTVLGNVALRKKYDRGLLSQSDLVAAARPSGKEKTGSSAKQQTKSRQSVVGVDGRGRIFDFDKFFKAHYNEQLQREKDIRVRKEEMLKRKHETIGEKKLGGMLGWGVSLMLGLAMVLMVSLRRI